MKNNLLKTVKKLAISTMCAAMILTNVPTTSSTAIGTVNVQAATKVKLSKTKLTLTVGKSATLKLNGTSKKVKWSTSNKKVATVTAKGKVTAKKKGSATITAKVGKKKYTCKVTVKAAAAVKANPWTYNGNIYNSSSWNEVHGYCSNTAFIKARPIKLAYDKNNNLVATFAILNASPYYNYRLTDLECTFTDANGNVFATGYCNTYDINVLTESVATCTLTFTKGDTKKVVNLNQNIGFDISTN